MEKAYNISLASNLGKEELDQFVADFKATETDAEMRKSFAASLSVPLFKTVAPQTSVRDIFAVDHLPAGSLPEYPIDLNDIETAVVMPRLGAVPQNLVVGDSLIIPTFEVANSVEWKLSFVRDGRFGVVERALEKLAESFVLMEEEAGWATIRGAIEASNTLTSTETKLTKALFNDLLTEMKARHYKPEVIYVSPRRAKDLREWTVTDIDPVTQREIYINGGMGSIWGTRIVELNTLGDDELFCFDTSKLGVMPIRTSLTTYDKPDSINYLRAGVLAWEEIGFSVIDKKAMMYYGGLTA